MRIVDIDKEGVSFYRALSNHAVCSGCSTALCIDTIHNNTCPYCNTIISEYDIVASLRGREYSAHLAHQKAKEDAHKKQRERALKRFNDGVQ